MKRLICNVGIVILDFLLTATLVLGDYLYNYRIPHDLPAINKQVYAKAQTDSSIDISPANKGKTIETISWKDKFAQYFTPEIQSTDMHYSSPNVAVSIEKKTSGSGADTITYFIADIHIASMDCIHSGFAQDSYGIGYREGLQDMSKRMKAVLAINGDSYSNDRHKDSGTIIRNGTIYREEYSQYDVCALYYDGTLKTFGPNEFDPKQAIADGAYQTWIFGPALLDENGKSKTVFNTWDYIRKAHPRTAIGYYEPGHYCMVLVDGRQSEMHYSRGMTLTELAKVFENLGCKAAYNLDGGHCSFMAMNGAIVNHPYKPGKDISDCIYIGEP